MIRASQIAVVLGWCCLPLGVSPASAADGMKFFEQKIRPVLVNRCYDCHGPDSDAPKGGLRVDLREGLRTGGDSGPAIVPGKPEESLLLEALRHESFEMPPDGKLDAAVIADFEKWIRLGAPDPRDGKVEPKRGIDWEAARQWWAFQPIADPSPPAVEDEAWPRDDLDRFILAKLETEGLEPAPEAPKATLLRRIYFDLIGLPPTPEQTAAFLADDSPTALEKVVDALLDDPRYGERWARHWLDLVRYAESDGFRQDAYRPHAWRYRDWVIGALNADMPYTDFARMQLAGDEIAPGDPAARVATMYYRHGPYEYNQRNVRKQWEEIVNEVTDTTADVFLGMGMGCARCHDHKFDPIPQTDYYRLRAFFAGILPRDQAPIGTPEQRAAHAAALAEWEAATVDIRKQIDAIEGPIRRRMARGAIEKFPQDIQRMIHTPPGEREPLEHQLAEMALRQVSVDEKKLVEQIQGEQKRQWEQLQAELKKHASIKPKPLPTVPFVIGSVGAEAPPTRIPGKKQAEAIEPGFLTVLDEGPLEIEPPAELPTTGRRTVLADWIASADNPLTPRVIVNRIWQHHFGRGLTATSSDFGHLGEPPSHPELLDWLTRRFMEDGWRLKPLHRRIVLSATYRQAALRETPEIAAKNDPQNRWLWRMPVRRLEAEALRDATLAVTGELQSTSGGPPAAASQPRRSIYTKTLRNTRDELLDGFDAPDAFGSLPERANTTNARQSLLVLNGKWMLARAEALARRVTREADSNSDRVRRAYALAYSRQATDAEVAAGVAFVDGHANLDQRPPLAIGRVGDLPALVRTGAEDEPLLTASALPVGDLWRAEAVVQLRSPYPDASVRTILSQWNGSHSESGWSLGVTSTKSRYTPRNLIVQIVGQDAAGKLRYEVVPSGLHLELNKPYRVRAEIRGGPSPQVVFTVQELFGQEEIQTATVKHSFVRVEPRLEVALGGRIGENGHRWDGLLGDVRLRVQRGEEEIAVAHWPLAEDDRLADAGGGERRLRTGHSSAERTAWIDLCHVLLASNEFLYVD